MVSAATCKIYVLYGSTVTDPVGKVKLKLVVYARKSWLESASNTLTVYHMIAPFLSSSSGGSHVRTKDLGERICAVTFCGIPLGPEGREQ